MNGWISNITDRLALLVFTATLLVGFEGGALGFAAEIRVPADHGSIQDAIGASTDGDTILIAPGSYAENIDFLGKAITVRAEVIGDGSVLLSGAGFEPTVQFRSGEGPESVLEGITIRSGKVAIFCDQASPTVRRNFISGNSGDAGVVACFTSDVRILDNEIYRNETSFACGIACRGGSPTIEGNSIYENESILGNGGGISLVTDEVATIRANDIFDNRAIEGGGIYCAASKAVIENNRIVRNTAREGAGLFVFGGTTPVVRDNLFKDNFAQWTGGAISVIGRRTHATIERTRFRGNRAGHAGGAVAVRGEATVTLLRALLFDNGDSLDAVGGAVYSSDARLVLNGCVFHENVAGSGGAIHVESGSDLRIVSCTLARNAAEVGGALACIDSAVSMANVVVWGNGAFDDPQIHTLSSVFEARFSDVEGGWPGEGNVDVDPKFVNIARGDVRLRIGSPCVDRGDGEITDLLDVDFEGDSRVRDGDGRDGASIDIGADEMLPENAVRFGTLNAKEGRLENGIVLRDPHNADNAGNAHREITLSIDVPFWIDVKAPSSGPDPAPFVIYAWRGEPRLDTLSPLPAGVGIMGFPTPFTGSRPVPVLVWNNLGNPALLGNPDLPSDPAPSTLVDGGIVRTPSVLTLQGIMKDGASEASVPFSVTNALVLRFE